MKFISRFLQPRFAKLHPQASHCFASWNPRLLSTSRRWGCMKTAVRQWSLVVGRAQEIRLRINNFLPLPSGGNSVVYNGSSTTELLRTTNGKRQTAIGQQGTNSQL